MHCLLVRCVRRRDLDELRARVVADLGQKDRDYLYSVIRAQRGFEIGGRALMYLGFFPPAWIAAVGALSVVMICSRSGLEPPVSSGIARRTTYSMCERPCVTNLTFGTPQKPRQLHMSAWLS